MAKPPKSTHTYEQQLLLSIEKLLKEIRDILIKNSQVA